MTTQLPSALSLNSALHLNSSGRSSRRLQALSMRCPTRCYLSRGPSVFRFCAVPRLSQETGPLRQSGKKYVATASLTGFYYTPRHRFNRRCRSKQEDVRESEEQGPERPKQGPERPKQGEGDGSASSESAGNDLQLGRSVIPTEIENDRVRTAAATAATLGQDPVSAAQAAASDALKSLEAPVAVEVEDEGTAVSPGLAEIYARCQTYMWRGFRVNYVVQGSGPPLLLVHGFGASIGHWRKNIPVLAEKYSVWAIDLLGQGASDKPEGYKYTIEGWAELILDFLREVVQEPAVLVGNSIGSLAVLAATADADKGVVKGIVLLNCAGGMNNKAVLDDWRLRAALPLFWLIDWLLLQPTLSRRLFDRFRSKANVKTVLQSVYSNKEVVDDELVEVIIKPADDEGALDAFVAIITGPPGPRPERLVPNINSPILLLWGDEDPFTPFDGPIARYFRNLPQTRPDVQFEELTKVGHCPHDDAPELVHEVMLPWLERVLLPLPVTTLQR